MSRRKPNRHDKWEIRAAAESIFESFAEDLYELPANERKAVEDAAIAAAANTKDWAIVKAAAFDALTRVRAVSDKPPTALAWSEVMDRFPDDQRLRDAGWRILRRPERGETVWIHVSGITMSFSEAVQSLAKLAEFRGR